MARVVFKPDIIRFGVVRERNGEPGVCLLDPITLEEVYGNWEAQAKGWITIPRDHLVYKWVNFFETVYGGDWYMNHCENCECDEYYLEDPHAVFAAVRKLFEV